MKRYERTATFGSFKKENFKYQAGIEGYHVGKEKLEKFEDDVDKQEKTIIVKNINYRGNMFKHLKFKTRFENYFFKIGNIYTLLSSAPLVIEQT